MQKLEMQAIPAHIRNIFSATIKYLRKVFSAFIKYAEKGVLIHAASPPTAAQRGGGPHLPKFADLTTKKLTSLSHQTFYRW